MKLEVGKKYRLEDWGKGNWAEILFSGNTHLIFKRESGIEQHFFILEENTWLPYPEPALDDTELWAWALCLDGANKKWYWANITMWHTEKSVRDEFPEAKGYRKLEALGSIRRED